MAGLVGLNGGGVMGDRGVHLPGGLLYGGVGGLSSLVSAAHQDHTPQLSLNTGDRGRGGSNQLDYSTKPMDLSSAGTGCSAAGGVPNLAGQCTTWILLV
jgi:hypothetical protein